MDIWIGEYVRGLGSAEYHLQIALLLVLLCYILFKAYKTYHRYRFISDTATSKIASAPQGYVELKGLGELMPDSKISSPFSQRRCLWYQCIVDVRKPLKNHSYWVEESNEISSHLFQLQDDSGECIIIPDGAHVIATQKLVWYGSSYQAKNQGVIKSWWFNRFFGFGHYRFTEKLISVADTLYVIGSFKSVQKNISTETLSQQADELIKYWKKNPLKHLKTFDRDNNGKIQNKEWTLIRRQAELEISKKHQQGVHHTVQKPVEENQPFVISVLSERQMLKKKQTILIIYLLLFFFLLYVLLTALNAQ